MPTCIGMTTPLYNMPPETFDDMEGYLPPYVPPEPTGDELLDMMLELQAYRAWQEKVRHMRSDMSGILTHQLSKNISLEIDKMIVQDLMKYVKEASDDMCDDAGDTAEEKNQNFYDSFSACYEISEENRNNGLDLPDI